MGFFLHWFWQHGHLTCRISFQRGLEMVKYFYPDMVKASLCTLDTSSDGSKVSYLNLEEPEQPSDHWSEKPEKRTRIIT